MMSRSKNLALNTRPLDWWRVTNYPSELLNQKFGIVLRDEDLSSSDAHESKGFLVRPRTPASVKASGISKVKNEAGLFQVTLDVDDFKAEDLEVKLTNRSIAIHGKHEEKKDEYGLVSREFCRRYMLPDNCDINIVTASLTTDGKLIIKVPKTKTATHKIQSSDVIVVEKNKLSDSTPVVEEKEIPGSTPQVEKNGFSDSTPLAEEKELAGSASLGEEKEASESMSVVEKEGAADNKPTTDEETEPVEARD